jgi:hypothetical protein
MFNKCCVLHILAQSIKNNNYHHFYQILHLKINYLRLNFLSNNFTNHYQR